MGNISNLESIVTMEVGGVEPFSRTSFQCLGPALRSRILAPGPGVHAPAAFPEFPSSNP